MKKLILAEIVAVILTIGIFGFTFYFLKDFRPDAPLLLLADVVVAFNLLLFFVVFLILSLSTHLGYHPNIDIFLAALFPPLIMAVIVFILSIVFTASFPITFSIFFSVLLGFIFVFTLIALVNDVAGQLKVKKSLVILSFLIELGLVGLGFYLVTLFV